MNANGEDGHVLAILGTYGPTTNEGDADNQSMWKRQERQMHKVTQMKRQQNPKEQYIHDLTNTIQKLKQKGYMVLMAGDTKINEQDRMMQTVKEDGHQKCEK